MKHIGTFISRYLSNLVHFSDDLHTFFGAAEIIIYNSRMSAFLLKAALVFSVRIWYNKDRAARCGASGCRAARDIRAAGEGELPYEADYGIASVRRSDDRCADISCRGGCADCVLR